ncbi:MAG: type II toxin-antitoxin system VapC family toxin [Burkholderiales bacterium]|nr:type II toxin-antitoxin system VapC family toxin [Burkholderiales bacterium]
MYLDTSALGALYIPEALSAAAAAALGAAPPAISALTEAEFASVVARRLRERTLSAADGAKVLHAFDAHLAEHRYRRLPVVAQTFADAVRLLSSGAAPLSTLDAIHLAVVASSREALCTADRQLARAAAGFGVKVHLIRA